MNDCISARVFDFDFTNPQYIPSGDQSSAIFWGCHGIYSFLSWVLVGVVETTQQADSCETTVWVVLAETIPIWGAECQGTQWNASWDSQMTNKVNCGIMGGREKELKWWWRIPFSEHIWAFAQSLWLCRFPRHFVRVSLSHWKHLAALSI